MMNKDRPQLYYGYVIVAVASVMMMMIWGTFNSFGVFFESFIKEFGWTRAVTSGASAVNTMIFGILCVFSAGLSERLGPRWVMTICSIILGVGYLLMARLASTWGSVSLFRCVRGCRHERLHSIAFSCPTVVHWQSRQDERSRAIGHGSRNNDRAAGGQLFDLRVAVAELLPCDRNRYFHRHGRCFSISQDPPSPGPPGRKGRGTPSLG